MIFTNYNFPKWKSATDELPKLIEKAFEVTAFSSSTSSYVTWFSNDFTQLIPDEGNSREIAGEITQAFIVRMTEKLELNKKLEDKFMFKPNSADYRAKIENEVSNVLQMYESSNEPITHTITKFILGMDTEFGKFRLTPNSKYYKDYKDFTRFVTKIDILKANLDASNSSESSKYLH